MGSPYAVAAVWIGLAFASALVSTRTGIAVSLVEILVGALVARLRGIAFAILTPFYFIRAGTYISARAVAGGAGLILLFLLVKMASKYVGVKPLASAFRFPPREAMCTTLLMSTGLTFGSISALYGLTHGIIGQDKYTVLVTVVILSALVPTLIAQQFFRPRLEDHLDSSAPSQSVTERTSSTGTVPE